MLRSYSTYWWIILVRGLLAILLGVVALVWTQALTLAILFIFGAYAFVDGTLAVVTGINHRYTNPNWWLTLLEGLAGITAGLVAFLFPTFAVVVALYLIAAWAIITGILEIATAIQLRAEVTNEWAMALTGLISIVLGIILVLYPATGATAIVFVLGIYALIFGALMVYLAFRVRSMLDNAPTGRGPF